jgi:hypothetical protein
VRARWPERWNGIPLQWARVRKFIDCGEVEWPT